MARTYNLTVPVSGDLLETLDDRRGLVPRGTFVRKLLEDALERGVRIVFRPGREGGP